MDIWLTRNRRQDVIEENVSVVASSPRSFRIKQEGMPMWVEHPEGRHLVIRLRVAPRAEDVGIIRELLSRIQHFGKAGKVHSTLADETLPIGLKTYWTRAVQADTSRC
eukprot:5184407-Pyramimonas_sp.AAC.1